LKFGPKSSFCLLLWTGDPNDRLSDIYMLPDENVTELRIYQRLAREDSRGSWLYHLITPELRKLKAIDIAEPAQQAELKKRLGDEKGTQTIQLWELWVNFALPGEGDAVTVFRKYRHRFETYFYQDAKKP
jgi:hypothetical protein